MRLWVLDAFGHSCADSKIIKFFLSISLFRQIKWKIMDIMSATIVSEVVQMREIKGNELVLMSRTPPRREEPVRQKPEWTEYLVRLAGFFLARAMPIEGVAPFGLAFWRWSEAFL